MCGGRGFVGEGGRCRGLGKSACMHEGMDFQGKIQALFLEKGERNAGQTKQQIFPTGVMVGVRGGGNKAPRWLHVPQLGFFL